MLYVTVIIIYILHQCVITNVWNIPMTNGYIHIRIGNRWSRVQAIRIDINMLYENTHVQYYVCVMFYNNFYAIDYKLQ